MRAKKKNKKRMDNMTKLLIPLAVAINMLAYTVLYSTTMLILGDSIGTILVGAICGPGPGAIVGLLSNLVNVIKNPVMIVMMPLNIGFGVVSGYLTKRKIFTSLPKTLLCTPIYGFIGGWLSGSIIFLAMGGDFWGNLASVFVGIPLYNAGVPKYFATSGEIIIDGINTKNQTTAQTAPHVGYVFQNPNDQIFNDDVIKEIEYVLRYWKLSEEEIKRRREEAIDVTGIRPYLEMHPFDIPLPIRKFLTIAVVVAVSPDYVILDEPTAGQDLWGCAQLRKVMDYLQSKGKAVITISHDMEYVAENFERIIVMAHKNVIADGKKEDIFYQKDKLQEAYVKPPLSTQIAQEVGIKKNILNMQELINCYK